MVHADLPPAMIALAESQSILLHVATLLEPLMARIDDLRRLNDNLVLIMQLHDDAVWLTLLLGNHACSLL